MMNVIVTFIYIIYLRRFKYYQCVYIRRLYKGSRILHLYITSAVSLNEHRLIHYVDMEVSG